jgi:hypothetical protein
VDRQKDKYETYVPAEFYKLQKAVIASHGSYVVLIVAEDPSVIEKAFDAAF